MRLRVLGVDAALDRGAAVHDVVLRERQRLARGDADLLLDQVDAGDHLGHRVLDLDAGVHLDEVVLAVAVDDELDRGGVGVVGLQDQPAGRLAHRLRASRA